MVDHVFIKRKLDSLVEYIGDLEEQQHLTVADLETDKVLRNHIERSLHKAVESCLDIGKHLIAALGLRTPEDYSDIMTILVEAGILPKEDLLKFKKMAQFRNVIVHNYEKIDPQIVLAVLQNNLSDLRFFARIVRDRINRGDNQGDGSCGSGFAGREG
ncbi:MAG: DUF86 domain-containing protein [Dethiobacter sp.]|nr:DUF86 domain-containing protein [Dethiobacter sp.]MBS3901482.1 DUF86 domain-containing protein [Dethiobacter sp.]